MELHRLQHGCQPFGFPPRPSAPNNGGNSTMAAIACSSNTSENAKNSGRNSTMTAIASPEKQVSAEPHCNGDTLGQMTMLLTQIINPLHAKMDEKLDALQEQATNLFSSLLQVTQNMEKVIETQQKLLTASNKENVAPSKMVYSSRKRPRKPRKSSYSNKRKSKKKKPKKKRNSDKDTDGDVEMSDVTSEDAHPGMPPEWNNLSAAAIKFKMQQEGIWFSEDIDDNPPEKPLCETVSPPPGDSSKNASPDVIILDNSSQLKAPPKKKRRVQIIHRTNARMPRTRHKKKGGQGGVSKRKRKKKKKKSKKKVRGRKQQVRNMAEFVEYWKFHIEPKKTKVNLFSEKAVVAIYAHGVESWRGVKEILTKSKFVDCRIFGGLWTLNHLSRYTIVLYASELENQLLADDIADKRAHYLNEIQFLKIFNEWKIRPSRPITVRDRFEWPGPALVEANVTSMEQIHENTSVIEEVDDVEVSEAQNTLESQQTLHSMETEAATIPEEDNVGAKHSEHSSESSASTDVEMKHADVLEKNGNAMIAHTGQEDTEEILMALSDKHGVDVQDLPHLVNLIKEPNFWMTESGLYWLFSQFKSYRKDAIVVADMARTQQIVDNGKVSKKIIDCERKDLEKRVSKDTQCILWPVNFGSRHWVTAVAFLQWRSGHSLRRRNNMEREIFNLGLVDRLRIFYFDSFNIALNTGNNKNRKIIKAFKSFLKGIFPAARIDRVEQSKIIPRQNNGYNCGFYPLLIAEAINQKLQENKAESLCDFNFEEINIPLDRIDGLREKFIKDVQGKEQLVLELVQGMEIERNLDLAVSAFEKDLQAQNNSEGEMNSTDENNINKDPEEVENKKS